MRWIEFVFLSKNLFGASRQRLRENGAIVIIMIAQTLSVVGFECTSRQIAAEAKHPQLAFSENGNVAR